MKKYFINDEQAYKGLDATTLELHQYNLKQLPNKNRYFASVPFGLLGMVLLCVGFIQYTPGETEFYILIVLGTIFFVGAMIFSLIAAIYLMTWKSFLKTARFTKCNIFIFVSVQECRDEPMRAESSKYYLAYYVLKVYFIDESGTKREKTIRSVLARDLYTKKFSSLIPEGNKLSLYGECIAAYNQSGKVRLIF